MCDGCVKASILTIMLNQRTQDAKNDMLADNADVQRRRDDRDDISVLIIILSPKELSYVCSTIVGYNH